MPTKIKNLSSEEGIAVYSEIVCTQITDVGSTPKFIAENI